MVVGAMRRLRAALQPFRSQLSRHAFALNKLKVREPPIAAAIEVHGLHCAGRSADVVTAVDAAIARFGNDAGALATFARKMLSLGLAEMARRAYTAALDADEMNFEARSFVQKEDDWNFVPSSACMDLDASELDTCREVISDIERIVADRRRREEAGMLREGDMPDGAWRLDLPIIFEVDGSSTSVYQSARDVMSGDPDVLRALRLYCVQFTGFQVGTLGWWHERPWFKRTDPATVDVLQRYLARRTDPRPLKDYSALVVGIPDRYRISMPRKFGEAGWQVGRKLISPDAVLFQQNISAMVKAGLIERVGNGAVTPTVLEIGGGYGGFAFLFSSMLDVRTRYILVDLPESLLFSCMYLRVMKPDANHRLISREDQDWGIGTPGFTFVPNYLAGELRDGSVDLAINTRSLDEMSSVQMKRYAELVGRALNPDGEFYERNTAAIEPVLRDHLTLSRILENADDETRLKRIWTRKFSR